MKKNYLTLIVIIYTISFCLGIIFEHSAYKNILLSIDESVPTDNCQKILEHLEVIQSI